MSRFSSAWNPQSEPARARRAAMLARIITEEGTQKYAH